MCAYSKKNTELPKLLEPYLFSCIALAPKFFRNVLVFSVFMFVFSHAFNIAMLKVPFFTHCLLGVLLYVSGKIIGNVLKIILGM